MLARPDLLTVLPYPAGMAVSDVQICRSLARTAICSSLEYVNPCGLAPEDRLLLSMSPHVLVPGAVEQEERHAAQRQQEQHERGLSRAVSTDAPGQSVPPVEDPLAPLLSGPQAAVAGVTLQQHVSSATPPLAVLPQPVGSVSAAAAVVSDPLSGDPLTAAAADQGSSSGSPKGDAAAELAAGAEQEFTDPLRRRTLQGDEGLLGEDLGLSEEAMAEEEVQDAAAQAALVGLPRTTQGLQLYDR